MNEGAVVQNGAEVLARIDGCRTTRNTLGDGAYEYVEGLTAPYMDPINNLCHVAANEPAKPPLPEA